jgi:hypothetical protein
MTMLDAQPALERDGYCVLDGLLDKPGLTLCQACADLCADEVRVWMLADCPPGLQDLLCGGPLGTALRRLLGPETCFLSAKAVTKGRTESRASPWHQDRPYWGGSAAKYSLWIACDDARRSNGCLQVIPGSHGALLSHGPGGERDRFVNRVEPAGLGAAVDVELRAGQAVLFHDLLLHASHPGTRGQARRSLIATYRACASEAEDFWAASRPVEAQP